MKFKIIDSPLPHHVQELHSLYLKQWWSNKRTLSDVEGILKHSSLVFLLVNPENQLVGFGRVLTDYVYKAVVMDIIVDEEHRNKGLSLQIMNAIMNHEKLKGITHFDLSCRPDMIPLYEKFGFAPYSSDHLWMRKNVV